MEGQEQWPLIGSTVRIGRDTANHLTIPDDAKVSRSHAELRERDGQWTVVDLGSRNGTRVNGVRIEIHPLRSGDQIQLGATMIEFFAESDPLATEPDSSSTSETLAASLSARESQVLALVAEGLTDREIGARLSISVNTVRSHLDRIAEKTGMRRRAELTRLAVDFGLVR